MAKEVTNPRKALHHPLSQAADRFVRDESGVITIFAVMMLLMMLMVSGIGVDLMRNEMERTRLQNTVDRAVLAAADLDQQLDPESVVEDYFDKAGVRQYLTSVTIDSHASYRSVTASARMNTPTQFMKMMGVETLPVPAISQAIERVPNVEISLVLDISGSMRFSSRMDNLRPAAKNFIDIVLLGSAQQNTSINLVPYAGQTNPGPFMFGRLGGVRYPVVAMDENDGGIPELNSHGILDPNDPGGEGDQQNVRYVYPNVSSCMEMATSDFNDADLPLGTFDQVPHFMNWNIAANVMDWGWCPQDQTAIKYASNNATELKNLIQNMRMHDGTGTHYAMKWAVALLNPTSSDDFTALSGAGLVPDEFKDRPAPWDDTETVKYIVLMTDGQITEQVRPKNTMDNKNPTDELAGRSGDRKTISSSGTNVSSFFDQCDLAKSASRNIVIYTIAFEAPGTPEQQMRDCASSPSHFFTAEGSNINDVFTTIARQINELRLTQ